MNARDRFLTTLKGGVADRVPLQLPEFQFSSREEIDAHPDPLRQQVARRAFENQVFRVVVPSYINRYLVTPPQFISTRSEGLPNGNTRTYGHIDTPKGELTFITEYSPSSDTSWSVKYPVESVQELEVIASVPWELPEELAPPDIEDFPEDFQRRGILSTGISSPFVCVGGTMPFERFLELTATHPELVAELTDVCRRRTLDVLAVLLSKPGIEHVWIGGSEWVTPPMASPATYDALVQEQERSLIRYIRAHSDAAVHIHCHGHVRHALQRSIDRGADYTEPVEPPPDGDVTMAEAKRLAGGRITLGGNIECRILCNESKDRVKAAVRAAFEGGKERFVLRPTEGPSPRMKEREYQNWMHLIDVWEKLSPI